MPDLSSFPLVAKWPAKYSARLQLYSLNTPNGVKASIMPEAGSEAVDPRNVDVRPSAEVFFE